jgi:FMN phosphatase YigB (HAD superfamily)
MADRPFDVVTFDCYGTLIDWEHGIRSAFAAEAAKLGRPLDTAAAVRLYVESEAAVEAGA